MTRLTTLLAALLLIGQATAQVYLDPKADLDARVADALSRMTVSEKIAIIHAQSKFSSPGVARLGIPELWCTDGPHGVRAEVKWDEWSQAGWTNDSCLAFPALTCLASTFDPERALLYGQSLGEEALYRGKDVLLGPGVNIYRTPLNGRNFEYMGEDPCLASTMVVPYIKGIQQNGVATCVKHYALNNQEVDRHAVNVTLSDRALYEIYLPAFRAACVEGESWSIMGSYNRYAGEFACHNHILLQRILRDEWDYKGCVITDWGGATDTEQAIRNGLDLEYGTWTDGLTEGASNSYDMYYLARPYREMIERGEVGTEELDEKAGHVLRLIFLTAMRQDKAFGAMCSEAHQAAARAIAADGMVLLKNSPIDKKKKECVLPIDLAALSTAASQHGAVMTMDLKRPTILVVGENAIKRMTVGGGSSSLKAKYEITPLQGIRERAEREADVVWVRGYVGDTGGEYNGVTTGQDLSESRSEDELIREAVEAAKHADVVIMVGGLNKSPHQDTESHDRLSYDMPYAQNRLIEALAAVNRRLVVVSVSGNAYAMPWIDRVPAMVQCWFSGSETGHALADVLFGDVNPSGRMPFTVMPALSDYPAHQYGEASYPGVEQEEHYMEDIFVGYRYADLYGKKRDLVYDEQGQRYTIHIPTHRPIFAFGHGLSYTSFGYAKAKVDGQHVSVQVTNTGERDGKEVVQLYVAPLMPSVVRPVKELKAFRKVALEAGESTTVEFELTDEMFEYFNAEEHEWTLDPGKYQLLIGSASDDIRCRLDYIVTE